MNLQNRNLGGKQTFDSESQQFDEYRESQSEGRVQRETFARVHDELERTYRVPGNERAEFLKEIEDSLTKEQKAEMVTRLEQGMTKEAFLTLKEIEKDIESDDPYLHFTLQQFLSMTPDEQSLAEAVAANRPFSEGEVEALFGLIASVDPVNPDKYTVFVLNYVRVLFKSMRSEERINLLANMTGQMSGQSKQAALGMEDEMIGILRAYGMISEHELKMYVQKRGGNMAQEKQILASVTSIRDEINHRLQSNPNVNVNYTTHVVEKPKSRLDRQATIGNVVKMAGMGLSGLTVFVNSIGAIRALKDDGVSGVVNHFKEHHLVLPAALTFAALSKSVNHVDRPTIESIMPEKTAKLSTLVEKNVGKEAITQLRDEKVYDAVNDRLNSLNLEEVNALKGKDVLESFPAVAGILKDKGQLPVEPYVRRQLSDGLINTWLQLREWEYRNYRSSEKLLRYCQKKYDKREKALSELNESETNQS